MATDKPLASLSLDLDNKWSYMKTHGDAGWESYPSYLDIVVPRVLEFLKKRDLSITFFVVGQDAALAKNHEALASLSAAGHEIGNHSFKHEPWLHLYTEDAIEDELARTEDFLQEVTGQRPFGFRGPGFSLSESVLRVLSRRGYQYDASTFPTFLGPLARAYYFMSRRDWTDDEWEKRKKLFGTLREGFRPLKPYRWDMPHCDMVEIPVTTMPLFKVPIHVSYLLYLGRFSPMIAMQYWRTAVQLCRATGTTLSLLLHPLDFMGCDDTSDLAFFPAMNLPHSQKVELVGRVIDTMMEYYDVCSMQRHAQALRMDTSLPRIRPQFDHTSAAA